VLPALHTPRLVLRPVAQDDVEDVWRLLTLPDVRRYLCDDRVLPRETVGGIVADHIAVAPQGLGMWILLHEGRFAGIAGLKHVAQVLVDIVPSLAGEVEPTVALDPALWGRGLAGEALGAVLAHGFATLGLSGIAGVCDVPNLASARMLARAGFRETGEFQGVFYRVTTWRLEREEAVLF
jgi:ribosomal-protein-alanine N-acetyltransferase